MSVSGSKPSGWKSNNGAGLAGSIHAPGTSGSGDSSPTLPNLATQPTLNSLINSSLSDTGSPDPAAVNAPLENGTNSPPIHDSAPPRVGDSARRMVGAALGVKHPGIAHRGTPEKRGDGVTGEIKSLGNAMGGLVIAE